MDTVTKTELRSAEAGPVLSGNAGDVLTFQSDGRTIQGAPIPPSSAGFNGTVSSSATFTSDADTLLLPLAFDPVAPFTSVTVNGWAELGTSEEFGVEIAGQAILELSVDGGTTWLATTGSNFAYEPNGAAGANLKIQASLLAVATGPATGDVQARFSVGSGTTIPGGGLSVAVNLTAIFL